MDLFQDTKSFAKMLSELGEENRKFFDAKIQKFIEEMECNLKNEVNYRAKYNEVLDIENEIRGCYHNRPLLFFSSPEKQSEEMKSLRDRNNRLRHISETVRCLEDCNCIIL